MTRSTAVQRLLNLVTVGVLVAGAARAGHLDEMDPAGASTALEPELALTCQVDICTTEFSFVLPTRRDDHAVRFKWETEPAPGYLGNSADTLIRVQPAGIGQELGSGAGYRYVVFDLVWHSDIRCDSAVTITALSGTASQSLAVEKAVPDSPIGAYCSDYGMPGELS